MWSVHPIYGLWHLLKAVVVFDADYEGPFPTLIPNELLSSQTKEEMKRLTNIAMNESWTSIYNWSICFCEFLSIFLDITTRLALRDACDLGKEWRYPYSLYRHSLVRNECDKRYEKDMIDYFYPIERLRSEVLEDIRKE